MTRLSEFKKQREGINRHLAMPISNERSKFNITDREVSGYPIVWDSINDYGELVTRGATLKSLNARGVGSNAGNKIQYLLHHDRKLILGKIVELHEDDYGLFFRATISEGISYCEEALIQIREKTLSQLSYGFDYVFDDNGSTEYDAERDVFILREIKLWEMSSVTWSSDANAQLRSYANIQAQLRLAQYDPEQIRHFMETLNMLSTADEATRVNQSVIKSLINKF